MAARLFPFNAALALLLAACSAERAAPVLTSVCELRQQAEHLVQVSATIEVTAAGTTVLRDASCPGEQVELRLTQAANRNGYPEKLRAALLAARAATPPKRVQVSMTGVLASVVDNGNATLAFTAEQLSDPTLQ